MTPCCRVIAPYGDLSFAGAAHSPLLVRRAHGTVDVLVFQGTTLGVRRELKFGQTKLHLASGDSALLYTDGLFSFKNPDGERLSHEAVAEALKKTSAQKEMLPELIKTLQNCARATGFEDDMAAIALLREG